jgi:hypothetical protein
MVGSMFNFLVISGLWSVSGLGIFMGSKGSFTGGTP